IRPSHGSERTLAGPPPPAFVSALRARGAERVSVGRVVVATWRPHETTARELIDAMGLDLQVILNKRAVMILPSGLDKGTGLALALEELGIPPGEVVGVGDAENDLPFLARCGLSVAVANALPIVKEQADHVTLADHGPGVVELIDGLLSSDALGVNA
ncbi:MAG: HAD family hydrolase, partial [Isosphaeraceae bacterium]